MAKFTLLEEFTNGKKSGYVVDNPLKGGGPAKSSLPLSDLSSPASYSPSDVVVAAMGPGGGGGGGKGIGGGGGSPGGGTPGGGPGGQGGGNGGGKPGGEGFGNNLSVPAIFPADTPVLRGTEGEFTFTTPTFLDGDTSYVYFAQGVEMNEWQAGNISAVDYSVDPVIPDFVNIGDALESAPIQLGRFVRLELSLFEEISDVTDVVDDTLTGFAMTLLGGAKGSGKPSTKGPTEIQGARLESGVGYPIVDANAEGYLGTTAYETEYAAVYAADGSTTEEEKGDSYLKLVIQEVEGLEPQYAEDASALAGDETGFNDGVDFLTGTDFEWNGAQWVDTNLSDSITVSATNLAASTVFGPELTVSGTYNVGVSQTPFKFTKAGTYLITFALEEGAPIEFDASTLVRNDDPALPGFQPIQLAEGRLTQVVGAGLLGEDGADTHNGLLAMLVGAPSSVGGSEMA